MLGLFFIPSVPIIAGMCGTAVNSAGGARPGVGVGVSQPDDCTRREPGRCAARREPPVGCNRRGLPGAGSRVGPASVLPDLDRL
jgi:hypothetical protein